MATDAINFEVEGLQELESKLLKLGAKSGSKTLRKALSKSARPVVKAAKALAPTKTGALRHSIGLATRKGRGKNVASVFVGPKPKNRKAIALANVGRSKPIKGVFYGHLVEVGYGRQPPQPFMRPALDSTAEVATKIFSEELRKELERVARNGTA